MEDPIGISARKKNESRHERGSWSSEMSAIWLWDDRLTQTRSLLFITTFRTSKFLLFHDFPSVRLNLKPITGRKLIWMTFQIASKKSINSTSQLPSRIALSQAWNRQLIQLEWQEREKVFFAISWAAPDSKATTCPLKGETKSLKSLIWHNPHVRSLGKVMSEESSINLLSVVYPLRCLGDVWCSCCTFSCFPFFYFFFPLSNL